jgi:hypothetical protein
MRARRARGKTANKILAIACSLGLIATMVPGYQLQSFGADLAVDVSEVEAAATQDEAQAQEPAEGVDANAQASETEMASPQDENALPKSPAGKSADTNKSTAAQIPAPKSQGLQLFDEPEPEYELVFADTSDPYTWTEEVTIPSLVHNLSIFADKDIILREVGGDGSNDVPIASGEIDTYLIWVYDAPAGSPITIDPSNAPLYTYTIDENYAYYSATIRATPTFDFETYNTDKLSNIDDISAFIKPIQVTVEVSATPDPLPSFTLESSATNEIDDVIYYNSTENTPIPLTLTQNNSDPYVPITKIEWQAYSDANLVSASTTDLLEAFASYDDVVEQSNNAAGFTKTLDLEAGDTGVNSIAAKVTLVSGEEISSNPLSVVEDNTAPEVAVSLSAAPRNNTDYLDISGTIKVEDDHYAPQTDSFLLPFANNGAYLTLELSYDSGEQQYTFAKFPDGSYITADFEVALKNAIIDSSAFQDKAGNLPDVSAISLTGLEALLSPFSVDTRAPEVTVNLSAEAGDGSNYQGISGEVIVTEVNYELQETIELSFKDSSNTTVILTLHQTASQPAAEDQHSYEFDTADFLDGAFTRGSLIDALRNAIAGDDAFKDAAGNAPNADDDPETADIAVNFSSDFMFDPNIPDPPIIIDGTPPEVTVLFEQPTKSDKAYVGDSPWVYYQNLSGTIIVEDANYTPQEDGILLSFDSNDPEVVLKLSYGGTLGFGRYVYQFIEFPDGSYTANDLATALQAAIAASDGFRDNANHRPVDIVVDSATVLDPSFVVDTAPPVVEVVFGAPTKSGEAYTDSYYQSMGGTVTVKEANYSPRRDEGISLTFNDSLNNEVILNLSYNQDERQYTFKLPDGSYAKGELEDALRGVIAGDDAFKDWAGNGPVNNKNNGDDGISLNLDSNADIAESFVIDSVPPKVALAFASKDNDSNSGVLNKYQNPDDASAYFQNLTATVTLCDENKLENLGDRNAPIECGRFTLTESSASPNQGQTRIYTISFTGGSYSYAEIVTAIQAAIRDKAGNHPDYQGAENTEDDVTVNSGPDGFNPGDPIVFDQNDTFTFVVDTEAPRPSITSSLSITNTSNNGVLNNEELAVDDAAVGYHVYGSDAKTNGSGVDITLSGNDELAGIQRLDYFKVAVSDITAEDLNTKFDTLHQERGGAYLTVDDFAGKTGGALTSSENDMLTLSYQETYRDGDRFIYVLKATDKAGMVAYYISDGIIVDTFEPAIEETSFAADNLVATADVGGGDASPRLYNGDVTMNIKVSDNNPSMVANGSASTTIQDMPEAIPVSSGLAPSFSWVITKDGQTVASFDAAAPPQLSAAEEGGIVRSYEGNPTWNDIVAHSRAAQGSFTVSAPQNNYNNLMAVVTVKDAAGNEVSETIGPFSIDTMGPVVAVSYDNDDVRNDRYFNAGRVAAVTVSDHNFLGSGMDIMAPGATLGAWSLSDTNGDMSTYTAAVSFSDDGDYTLDIAGADAAANRIQPAVYEGAATQDFTVDLTNPVLSVAYDNNDVRNDRYYNAARTGTVTVVEHNFGLGEGATVNVARDGAEFSSGGGWTESGDTHTSSIPYSIDGEYTFHAEYTDLAGNAANVVPDEDFIVDLTAPTLEFLGEVQNMRAFNSAEITPLVAFHDQNYDANGARVTLSRVQQAAGGAVDPRDTYTLLTDGQQAAINAHNTEVGRTGDGIYTLTAAITDLAGNESTGSINYSINRFGSTWYIEPSSATQHMLDAYYTNAPATVEIHEVNVSEVQNQQVSFAHAGEVTNLSRGQGYTVASSGADNQWKDYTYKLAASNFVVEGLYEVTVYSEDSAGNTSTTRAPKSDELNPADSLPIDFVVDMTPPSIVLTGAEDNGRYAESERILKINVEDNLALDTVDVYLNDSVVPSVSFSAVDMKELNNTAEFRVPTSGDFQVIRVNARDMAGNVSADAVVRNILVNPSPLVQFVRNTPAFAGSMAGVLVLAAAVAFFIVLWHRRRKEKGR